MQLQDFFKRWKYHYINDDFLKIEQESKYIELEFLHGTCWLKQGGYGQYKNIFTEDVIQGYLFYKNSKNELFYVINGKYYSVNNLLTPMTLYNYTNESSFLINKSGVYYFLTQYINGNTVYSLSYTDKAIINVNGVSTEYDCFKGAPCYQINVSKDIISQYGAPKNKITSENKIKYFIAYYQYGWKAETQLSDVREDYSVPYKKIREWVVDSNGNLIDTADLWAAAYFNNLNYNSLLLAQNPNYMYESGSYTLSVIPTSFDYVSGHSSSANKFYYSTHISQITPTITWNIEIEEGNINGYYKHHSKDYNIILNENFGIGWEDKYLTGQGKKYTLQKYRKDRVEGYIQLTDITSFIANNVLQLDTNVRINSIPSNLDEPFWGWTSSPFSYDIAFCGEYYLTPTSNYGRTSYYNDKYRSNENYLSINSLYEGYLFVEAGVEFNDEVFRTPGGPGGVYRSEKYPGIEITASQVALNGFRYGSGPRDYLYNFTFSEDSTTFPQASDHLQPSPYSGGDSTATWYWYNNGENYIQLSSSDPQRIQRPGIHIMKEHYTIYGKKGIDYSKIENWTRENLMPTYLKEDREKFSWEMANADFPQPENHDEYQQDLNINLVDYVWMDLPQDIQDYIGQGIIDCTVSALQYCLQNNLVETELGKVLKTYPNPADVL